MKTNKKEVLEMRANNFSYKEIGEKFSVTPQAIYEIVKNSKEKDKTKDNFILIKKLSDKYSIPLEKMINIYFDIK